MGSSTISLGLGLGGGKSATSSGTSGGGGGGAFANTLSGSFDGTDDYLTTNESNLATSGDCTISLWFNSASLPGSGLYGYMFSLTDGRSTGKDRAIGILGTGSDAQIVANTYGSGWNKPFTNTSISANTWYHVTVVYTSGNAQVYLNGIDKGSKSVSTNTISYNQTVIGSMLYLPGTRYFNGKIDEVSVFHSALSSTDITAIYNGGVPGDLSTLSPKGWWRNGDGTGDTDSGGGTPANTDTIGTVANQGTVNTGSGQGNMTGTNGPTFSTDVPTSPPFNQYSVSLDGTDDYIDIPDSTSLELSTFSWSAWIKIDTLNQYNMIVDTNSQSGGNGLGYTLFVETNNKISFWSYNANDKITSTTVISANTWYHVAATHTSGSDKLYINGTLEASGSASNFQVSDAS
jgi:hypothetical protein